MESSGRLGSRSIGLIVGLCLLSIAPGLMARLSYHEAIVAQGVREMRVTRTWLVPLLDNRPWLEKPPLLHWLVKIGAAFTGDATEIVARTPSLLAAISLALAIATLGTRRFNPQIGLLAGCIQATTFWTITRGRLAESDMLLACLIAWIIVGFDALRTLGISTKRLYLTRCVLLGIGATALMKGVVFGGVLIVATIALILAWDRDRKTCKVLCEPVGIAIALLVALSWPAMILSYYPEVLNLWTSHITDRLADRPEVFAGQASWWAYIPVVLSLTLPWTPFALMSAWRSLRRAWNQPGGLDRLLCAWAVVPLVILSMATVKNPHYAIHALGPWSIWAALGLAQLGKRLESRGWSPLQTRKWLVFTFLMLAAGFGIGNGVVAPRLDKRSMEWGFYDEAARLIPANAPLVLLYDDWDRLPYPTPFGPVPHDLAVRLYYLNRPAFWREGKGTWDNLPSQPFMAIARARDLDGLARVGRVESLLEGPRVRWDRLYAVYRVTPESVAHDDVALTNGLLKR